MSRPANDNDSVRRSVARQRAASDPSRSSWVSAHAGSGKTTVLAQRVIRLLTRGVPPSRILCLTFTRAAAAEMAQRVFRQLSAWTELDDEELAAQLGDIGEAPGDGSSEAQLRAARRLFAAAIDTPGGLKIQTLHAFCERLLHAFPFEADVAANFRVLEDFDSARLLRAAMERTFGAARADAALGAAFVDVAESLSGERLQSAVKALIGQRHALAAFDARDDFTGALRKALGLPPGITPQAIQAEILGAAEGLRARRRWIETLRTGSKTDQKIAEGLFVADAAGADLARACAAYIDVFINDEGKLRVRADLVVGTKSVPAATREELTKERDRVKALCDVLSDIDVVERSGALFAVAKAAWREYVGAKAREGALDFDDLTAHARALLERDDAGWVLYKLDGKIDHILVDEAQDTSLDQWKIIEALSKDWLSGEGRGGARSLFAVGDEKQSIFSFNGARPELLDANRRLFETRHRRVERAFRSVELDVSFRSAPIVLEAVDLVIGQLPVLHRLVGEPADGEAIKAPEHRSAHETPVGRVELWPTIPYEKPVRPEDWAGAATPKPTPAVVLARRIAKLIEGWLRSDSPERIGYDRRPIRAGDIMILVRKRAGFFDAINRALKLAGVPTAGADRIALNLSVAPMDLVALGRALLTPEDDLNLAVALKSPLFGFDDNDLIVLAPNRDGSLRSALTASANAKAIEAAAKLDAWSRKAREDAPFDFFTWLLGDQGKRRAFVERLGPEAHDALDEFLAFALAEEAQAAPALQTFLDAVESNAESIKRDLDAAGDLVRVMTVHAAKGLEAPIVFLPDTMADEDDGERAGDSPKLLFPAPADEFDPPIFLWPGPKTAMSARVEALDRDGRHVSAGEHRRLLYVAMTRAAERLIVCGFEGAKGVPNGSWYAFVSTGLSRRLASAKASWSAEETILAMGEAQQAADVVAKPLAAPLVLPDWLKRPPIAEAKLKPRRASAEAFTGQDRRRAEGRYFHFLLETLANIAPEGRARAAEALSPRSFAVDSADAVNLRIAALAILADAKLAPLFAQGSRGEASISSLGSTPLDFRIDRLALVGDEVWIADFKLGAEPARPPREYAEQMAAYRSAVGRLFPNRRVRSFLVWSVGAKVSELGADDIPPGEAEKTGSANALKGSHFLYTVE